MNLTLQPILHRESYTRAVEGELLAWMREAIFDPLLIELLAAGVKPSPEFQAIKFDEAGRMNDTWTKFPAGLQSLGFPRTDMPKISPQERPALMDWLRGLGVSCDLRDYTPADLRPSQGGYWEGRVAECVLNPPDQPIIVAMDGDILDGHHQWFAALLSGAPTIKAWHVEASIRWLMRLVQRMPAIERLNAVYPAVMEALSTGRIHYAAGVFSGKFSAAISKELRAMGAQFSRSDRHFWLTEGKLPDDIKGQVAQSMAAARKLHDDVISTLNVIEANVAAAPLALNLKFIGEKIINDLGHQFVASVTTKAAVEADISVPADFIGTQREKLTEQLTENLTLGIKGFAAERIPELRRRVEENIFAGMRTDELAKIIEAEFGVSKRKAEFLADQETGLLVSKYRQTRCEAIGIKEYIWSTSHDAKVRHTHRLLDGKKFSFDNPPVVTGPGQPVRHCNPGEDYRCRCVARPVVTLQTTP